MTTLRNAFLTCGAEIEIANDRSIGYRAVSEWHSLLHNNGFNWVRVESDATSGVDAEVITPPFSPYSTQAKNDIGFDDIHIRQWRQSRLAMYWRSYSCWR